MRTGEGLVKQFHERRFPAPFCRALTINETGLTLGAGTVLARMTQGGHSHVAFDGDEVRILALLAVAFGKSVPVHVIGKLRRAAEQWSRGDKCLAHIHLAFAGLPQIDEDGAARLTLANEALAMGLTPRALLKALGLDSAPLDALKFDPSQPRVPAGSGPESGRWTSDENGSGSGDPLQTGRSISAGEQRREDKPERELEEEKRTLGTETEEEEVRHGHPIDPGQVPMPLLAPSSRSVLIGNNARPSGKDRINSDLLGGTDEAKALFDSLTTGQGLRTFVTEDGVTITRADDGTQLRIKADGSVRVERSIDIAGRRREIIHFNPDR